MNKGQAGAVLCQIQQCIFALKANCPVHIAKGFCCVKKRRLIAIQAKLFRLTLKSVKIIKIVLNHAEEYMLRNYSIKT